MSASSDGVVARGESSGITLRLGLLQQACLLGPALVLLVMARVRFRRFPLVFFRSGEDGFAASTHSGFFSVYHAINDVFIFAFICVANE
jgi:hypothetical protein